MGLKFSTGRTNNYLQKRPAIPFGKKFFRDFLNCGLMALSGHARNLSHCCGKTPPQLCLDAIQFGFALGIFVLSANLPFNLCASHSRVRLSLPGCDQTLC
jgi:hypothetical protein